MNASLLVFVISLLITGWYGGLLPVMLSTILSVSIGYIFFTVPYNQLSYKGYVYLERGIIFILEGLIIGLISESRLYRVKEIEKYLRQTQRQKRKIEKALSFRDEFVSIASHELKTPVTTLQLVVQILQKKLNNVSRRQNVSNYLNKMDDQIHTLNSLIDDLLNVSKIQAGKLEISRSPADIQKLVSNTVEIMQINNPKHIFSVKGKINKLIECDEDRISQVLTNLLSNAVKYSPDSREILITLTEKKGHVSISVQDFGIGIEPANQPKIFNRFFRSEGKNQKIFAGFGLGLFISKEIIRQHNGKIWVESALGKGSTFYFTLPV